MPKYYFHLCDDSTVPDIEGTVLGNLDEARQHASVVAKELTFHSSGMLGRDWSRWVMSVRDDAGSEVFSLKLNASEPKS